MVFFLRVPKSRRSEHRLTPRPTHYSRKDACVCSSVTWAVTSAVLSLSEGESARIAVLHRREGVGGVFETGLRPDPRHCVEPSYPCGGLKPSELNNYFT